MKIEFSRIIKAPINKVFDVFSDISQADSRISGIKEIEILEGGKGLGTKWKETRVMFGKDATEIMWISEFEPNKSYTVDAESNGMKYRSVYNFKEMEDGTKVEGSFEGTAQTTGAKIFSYLAFMFAPSMRKAFMADMDDLAKVCEEQA